jgi:hypothetical protein
MLADKYCIISYLKSQLGRQGTLINQGSIKKRNVRIENIALIVDIRLFLAE